MEHHHILLVTFPAQGHINPAIQFAKRLTRLGIHVTLATTISAHRRMSKIPTLDRLSFAGFSDGYDDGLKPGDDVVHYMSEISRVGSQTLTELIVSTGKEGLPFTCIVYSILIPWVAEVAHTLHLPSALLWNQPASVLGIYYYYFYGYGDVIRNNSNDPSWSIELPGLPLLGSRDLPSFVSASNIYTFALPLFKKHFELLLEEKSKPKILVNTFDAIEHDALRAIDKFDLIPIGPLIPSAFLDGKDPSDTSFGGDLLQDSKDYIEWLNSKPKSSVIYVSFGTLAMLTMQQTNEIARGLLDTGRPFLWVMRGIEIDGVKKEMNGEEEILSCMDELERQGMIVPWCCQLEVLSSPSLGCFVTHCGWNSSLESLVSGVPVVAFPQWTDQGTNAKLIEGSWRTGVRVNVDEGGIVKGEEIKRCLELVMGEGEKGEDMRKNAKKLKELAKEAVLEGGSSYKNLKDFVDEIDKKI